MPPISQFRTVRIRPSSVKVSFIDTTSLCAIPPFILCFGVGVHVDYLDTATGTDGCRFLTGSVRVHGLVRPSTTNRSSGIVARLFT